MQKRLIITLSVCLGVALLVIAFLAGRMTTPSRVVVEHETQSAPQTEQPSATEQDTPPSQSQTVLRDAPSLPRDPIAVPAPAPRSAAPSTPPAIAEYFAKIDAIQLAGAGDPTTFAQGILGGLQAGDTSGLDSLINSAKLALVRTTAVQPPPACAEYHRRLLESLSESSAGMDKMRSALKSGDVAVLGGLTTQFQASQQKVEDLDRMRKQLLGQ